MFSLLAKCQHLDRNQLVRRSTLDLNIDLAHGLPARCPAWPTNRDDGFEDIRWIHELGDESLPAASYGILPNLGGKNYLLPFETDGEVVSSLSSTPAANYFLLIIPLVSSRHMTPVMV